MKVKMRQVVNSTHGLRELGGLKLPGSASLSIVRASKQIDAVLADFSAARKKLIEDFGLVADDKGNYPFPDADAANAFMVEMDSILDAEVDINVATIPFSKIANAELSPGGITSVEWLLDLDA